MTVRVERDGQVTTVILDRPAVRNAVDGPTAAALAGAFRSFDAHDGAHVAVLWGAGGTSAPVPTSRRSAARTATGPRRTATGRWGRPGCGWPSR